MITVTERAAAGLQELREANDALPGQGVKLVPTGTGSIGMTIAAPSEGDEVIRRGDEPLLIVDGRIAGALTGPGSTPRRQSSTASRRPILSSNHPRASRVDTRGRFIRALAHPRVGQTILRPSSAGTAGLIWSAGR